MDPGGWMGEDKIQACIFDAAKIKGRKSLYI